MVRKLRDETGSTLMLILITVAILTMLGTALLAMSLMNVTMKANDKRIKETTYLAESGIDQAYGLVGKAVENAIEYALIQTDAEVQGILADIADVLSYIDPVSGILDTSSFTAYQFSIASDYLNDYINEDYTLNGTELEDYSGDRYKHHFKDYMNTNAAGIKTIVDSHVYDPVDAGGSITITTLEVDDFGEEDAHQWILRDVRSEFELDGMIKRVITTDIVVTDEVTSYPLNTVEDRISVPDNPLWQQAIVANENIHIKGNSQVTIDGNVYGLGIAPSTLYSQNADPLDYGGLIFDGTSDTTIKGNVYTRNYFQLGENSNSTVIVNDGAVYANTVIAQSGSNGLMDLNGNVYTSDDLEHNGQGSDIEIYGSYYGYSDGSVGLTHDSSSAVVINADTSSTRPAGVNPRLTVAGNSIAVYDSATNPGASKTLVHGESASGVMIGGTGYIDEIIDTTNQTRYQMGESVAFRENALAYTWAFNSTLVNSIISDVSEPFVTATGNDFNIYTDDATQDERMKLFVNQANVDWHNVTGSVNLSVGTNNETPGDSSDDYLSELRDKKAIFATFQNYVDTSNSFINRGNGLVAISNYFYTTGLQLNSGQFIMDIASQSTFDDIRLDIEKDIDYQLHMLEARPSGVVVTETVGGGNPPVYSNANPVKKYSDIESVVSASNSYVADGGVIEVVNISPASSTDLIIDGGSGTSGDNVIYMNGATQLQGIVLRAGDIYIEGDVVFEGALITDKSVYVNDNASLSLTNQSYDDDEASKEMLARLIYNNDDLYALFNVSSYYDITDTVNLGSPIEYSTLSITGDTYDSNNNSVFTYYDWIYFKYWKVAE